MISISMQEIANQLDAEMIGENVTISHVETDSRKKELKGLFVALKGPSFDAHQFIKQVEKTDVDGVVVDHDCKIKKPQLVVKDTRKALAALGKLNRDKSQAITIAITGSSGKTTVKEMIASILQLSGMTCSTKGNLNNEIGAPLTLLNINEETKYCVIELGANHSGEIAFTSSLSSPNVALVNNVSSAHLEGFGSVDGVAKAKGEIYAALDNDGTAVLNIDDSFFKDFKKNITSKIITFSISNDADVMAKNIRLNSESYASFELHYQGMMNVIQLPMLGIHNVSNALAAVACCLAIKIPLKQIKKGLEKSSTVSGRLNCFKLVSGCRVIDDTYNANVASVKAAIDLLKNYPAPRVLVLGDMGELGVFAKSCHETVGLYAKDSGIETLFTIGELTYFTQNTFSKKIENDNGSQHFEDDNKLVLKLKKEAIAAATILIKGSRSAHMENIVQALIGHSKINTTDFSLTNNSDAGNASLQGKN